MMTDSVDGNEIPRYKPSPSRETVWRAMPLEARPRRKRSPKWQVFPTLAKGAVLLVFYPGDDTPVCTKQLCNYRDNLDTFRDLGVQVVAINPQSEESHRKFADKHTFPFPVVADAGKTV